MNDTKSGKVNRNNLANRTGTQLEMNWSERLKSATQQLPLPPEGARDINDSVPAVLFLDFDGVLHRLGEEAFDENWNLIETPNLFCWRHFLEDALAPHPSVRIVVSSDWRRLYADEILACLLGPVLGPRMLGAVELPSCSRAQEILVDAARRGVTDWIALDDHPTVAIARRAGDTRFIVCEPETGLSNVRVRRELIRKLSELVLRHRGEYEVRLEQALPAAD